MGVQADVEDGERPGLTNDERSELVRLRRDTRVQAVEFDILGFRLVHELADDSLPVAVISRVLNVSKPGYCEWLSRLASVRGAHDAYLLNTIHDIHATSRQIYGARRVHTELTLGRKIRCGRGRVERLMALGGLQGVHRRKWRHGGGRSPAVFEDRVRREFVADSADEL